MESLNRKLDIRNLKSRLALRTFICASLAKQIETARLIEKPAITGRWEQALKDCQIMQLLVDLLERQEREERGTGPLESATVN